MTDHRNTSFSKALEPSVQKGEPPTIDEDLALAREILADPEYTPFSKGGPAVILRIAVDALERVKAMQERLEQHTHEYLASRDVTNGFVETTPPVGVSHDREDAS